MVEGGAKKPSEELTLRKAALQRTQEAERAVSAATKKRQRAESLRYLDTKLHVYVAGALADARRKGEDPESIDRLERYLRQNEEDTDTHAEEWKSAEEEERRALEELTEASREFGELTVEPRVEAAKLEFEEHKLRATLSSASIVGVAATVGILLPTDSSTKLSYVPVLGVAFVCLFVSTVMALGAMKAISAYVESIMTTGTLQQPSRVRYFLIRHTFTIGLAVFAVFVLLNLVLGG